MNRNSRFWHEKAMKEHGLASKTVSISGHHCRNPPRWLLFSTTYPVFGEKAKNRSYFCSIINKINNIKTNKNEKKKIEL